jgi:hypothetical protein
MMGVVVISGNAATRPSAGRSPRRRKVRIRPTTTPMLMSSSGSRNMTGVGPPSQKNGAAIHACTPSM